MKDFDNIEDWYKDELDKFNVNPDDNVWQSLSDDLDADMTLTDENIGDWYKREVKKLEERPDYTVWEKLATKLDTASVWDKLVVSLNRYDKLIWWRNVAIKGTAILLLLTASYLTYNNYKNSTEKANNKIGEKGKQSNPSLTTNNKTPLLTPSNTFKHTSTSNRSIPNAVASSVFQEDQKQKNSNTSTTTDIETAIQEAKNKAYQKNRSPKESLYASAAKEVHINGIDFTDFEQIKSSEKRSIITDIDRHEITEKDISQIYESSDFLVKKEKNKIVFNSKRFSSYFTYGLYARRFYVGLNAGVKKQGLITSIKKDAALAQYNEVDYLDYGSNFGLTAGYIVSDKFNLESNINILSTSGYKRRFNSEGVSIDENLNLSYSTINVLAKKMNTKSTFDNKVYSTNLIGGVYASFLHGAKSDVNGNTVDLDHFNSTDLGIVLGIEQDRYLTKSLMITPGIRYNQGLTNIAGDNSSFSSARNFSFELNLGVKYIFLKKSR